MRRKLQCSAEQLQPAEALPDCEVETDEMFQNAGEKGRRHSDASDPPRRRGNKRRGHGTYDNDRPPIVGTVGRESGQLRLRVVHHTESATLSAHVHRFTCPTAIVYTDGWRGYNQIERVREIVLHKDGQWARDADGDGINEIHTNTIEGVWTTVHNFLRPFRGVHKKFLSGYIAICEFARNTIVSGSSDKTIRLWNANTGQLITTLTGHADDVNSVSFSPDGSTVVSGSHDGTTLLWELEP